MTAALTVLAGEFAAGIDGGDIPDMALATVRLGFSDAIACLLAGRDEPVTHVVKEYADGLTDGRGVPVLLGRGSAPPELAALVDATAAHALDYDDYMFSNHPSAVMVPAIMACAHHAGADGARMVRAYVAGYEIWGDLMLRETDHLHSKGWHPTAVLGPVGAATAAAHMLGLDAGAATRAIAIAASHSGGLMGNFGAMTKAYHAGRAAAAGVRAALLARAGFTAKPDVLESPVGLMAALSPNGAVDLDTAPQFGRRWRSAENRLNIKKYPTVGASQRIIDSVLAQQASAPVSVDDIGEISIRISRKFAAVMPFADPQTPAEAKFSAQFACAAALRFGRVGMAEVTQEALDDPQLRRLIGIAKVDAVEEYDPGYPNAAPHDWVTLTLTDGTGIETPKIHRATGHADAPLSHEEHWTKFLGCAAWGGVDETAARRMFDALQSIETAPDIAALNLTG